MPKVSIQVGKRVRIDCDYDDYKQWEKILKSALQFDFKEETTFIQTEHGNAYWKSMVFKIGETEYRIGGPLMPKSLSPERIETP